MWNEELAERFIAYTDAAINAEVPDDPRDSYRVLDKRDALREKAKQDLLDWAKRMDRSNSAMR